jgi:acyl carrier protein
MTSLEKLHRSFMETLGLSKAVNLEKLEYQSVEQWDSVGHMALIASIEDEFDIMLETDDVIDMSSFLKSKEILKKYGINFEN